jgi:hypothetical protein
MEKKRRQLLSIDALREGIARDQAMGLSGPAFAAGVLTSRLPAGGQQKAQPVPDPEREEAEAER